jgi:xanthine dehydrogenase accessory factor
VTTQLSERIDQLTRSRVPFVQATVVRAQEPSSAHAGDRAIVLADGSIEGFVGGQCAAGSVRTAALDALQTGVGVLLRVLPDSEDAFPQTPGASIVVNPCLSGGALEIYLEPLLPSPSLHVVGTSPVAEAMATLAPTLGFVVDRAGTGVRPDGAVAVVVASHGGDEPGAIRAALDAGVGFVGVVCSHTRGEALLAELDLTEEERRRVHTHVGIDIGARTAPEIALSILAEVVRRIRLEGLATSPGRGPLVDPLRAVDPVCGMTVTIGPDTIHAVVDGTEYWFCNPGCRDSFVADHRSGHAS